MATHPYQLATETSKTNIIIKLKRKHHTYITKKK